MGDRGAWPGCRTRRLLAGSVALRILIVDPYYPAALDFFYASRPVAPSAPYQAQWRELMDLSFGTADAYSHWLRDLGHEAHEVVPNARPLQLAWAREHAPRLLHLPWRIAALRILLAQVAWLDADVVYVQSVGTYRSSTLRRLRGRKRLLAGQIATEAPADDRLRSYNVLFTSFPHYVERFSRAGMNAELLRIGFDERVRGRLGDPPRHDLVFVGQLSRTQHGESNDLLERAARSLPLEVWGPGVEGWPPGSPFRERHRGTAWGLDMYRVLAGARIALNRHGAVAEGHANNMRLFEATGVGTMLLTDERIDLEALFAPGREVLTYSSAEDLVEKARWYLEHEDARAAIATAGQARTLSQHTYRVRMRELAHLLAGYL